MSTEANTDLARNTRNHSVGDKVTMKRDPNDYSGRVLEILPHPAYGRSYLVKWTHLDCAGDGWCDHDLA